MTRRIAAAETWAGCAFAGSGLPLVVRVAPHPEHGGQRRESEFSRSGAGHLAHDAQPDRSDLTSGIVKMILVTYKFDVPPDARASA
jgi:hypothetical protein